ncbi:MAG: RodZ domain-containing protein [Lysinibacillus sp.]
MLLLTELGARLKEARLAKGYSLEDLQEITKIQKRYLIGIEEGNYSSMPGSFYVRAFIKQYADAVGLNPDELLDEYKREVPGSQTEEVAQSFTQSPNRKTMSSKSRSNMMEAMPKLIVALFVVVIIAVIVILVTTKTNETSDFVDEDPSEVEYVAPTPEPEPAPEDEADEEEPAKEEEPVVEQVISPGVISGEDVTHEVSNTDALKIRIEVGERITWVGIRDASGAEKIEARVYQPGEVVEYDSTADSFARIRLGDALATKVFVNDQELPFDSTSTTQNIILKLVATPEATDTTETTESDTTQ